MKRLSIAFALMVGAAGWAAGCGSGDVSDTSLPKPAEPGPVSDVTGTNPNPPPSDCVQPACQVFPLAASAHAVRMTSPQWERTVKDLLKLGALPGNSSTFPPDPVASADRFGSEASQLVVSTEYWSAYQTAAESLAALVTGDPDMLNAILPVAAQSGDTPTRVAAFVADFLPRAYRRAVTQAEVDAVTAAGEQAAANVSMGDPFVVRVQWLLTAVLQSPKFIYRIALGDGPVKDGRARMTGYEVATKLSYGLWGTMPDDALIAQAKAGKLDTAAGVASVASGMLQDPRAEVALLDFHDQLYLIPHYTEVKGSARPSDQFPTFYDTFMADAQTDMRNTVRELVITNNGGFKDLVTSNVAFINNPLAASYGIDPTTIPEIASATNDVFAKVQLDAKQRKGLLMHVGWLAYEGSPTEPSPIHRGAFMARHVVCAPLGSPPAGAAGADPSKAKGNTNRDRVTITTAGCGDGCHGGKGGVINPLGFGFENFDSIGKVRTMDGAFPIDTTGAIDLIGNFASADALFDTVSTNARAHACYAAHWASYLNGTSLVDVTPKWLSPAVAKSLKNGSVRDVIVELVQTDAFLTVSR